MHTRWITTLVAVGALGLAIACTPAVSGDGDGASETTASSSTSSAPDTTGTTGTTTTADPSTGAVDSSTTPASSSGPSTGLTDGSTTTTDDSTTSESTGGAAGLGMISGECGLIDTMEIDSPSPFTFDNAIDFRRAGFDYDLLTPEGQQVFDAGNLGGSSLHSEVIAFEVLARCEGASLLATEGEIVYDDPMGTKTDILVEIDGWVVGVSVTRAVGFPFDAPYTEMQAANLLTGKLEDIQASSANVSPPHEWRKQILHVIAYADMHVQSIHDAYATLAPELTADTILVVTVTHGDDAFVY